MNCFNYKYENNSVLSLDKVLEIKSIGLKEEKRKDKDYVVEYKLSGLSVLSFEAKDYEEVVFKDEKSLIVKATVKNEFFFIQRLLLFGADFKIISPSFFKEKLINKIKSIQGRYING